MMEHSPELDKLATALAKAQAAVTGAVKDTTNPHFNRKYADLASVWEAMRGPFTANGLSVVHLPGFTETTITLETILLHASGQWIKGTLAVPFEVEKGRNASQSIGSAITYMRRYVDAAIGAVCPEDDDGNASGTAATETHRPAAARHADIDGVVRRPGDASKWDGWGGKPLTDVPTDVLTKVRKWMADKDPVKNKVLVAMMSEVLEARREAAELNAKPAAIVAAEAEDRDGLPF